MKHVRLLPVLLLGMLLLWSCSKDNDPFVGALEPAVEISTPNTDVRAFEEEDCGYIRELCMRCIIIHEPAPHEPVDVSFSINGGSEGELGAIDDDYFRLVIGEEEYTIRPANYFEGSDEYAIMTSTKNYITSNRDDDYLESKALDDELPVALQYIYSLDNDAFAQGGLSLEALQQTFGMGVQVSQDEAGTFVVYIQNDPGPGNPAAIKIYDPCKGVTMAALTERYVDVLGEHLLDAHKPVIEDGLDHCAPPDFDPKRDCIDSKCVVDYVVDELSFSTFAVFEVRLSYLRALLKLSDEDYDALRVATQANIDFVNDLYESLNEDDPFPFCEKAECSRPAAYQSVIGAYLDGQDLSEDDIDEVKDFFEQLYCDDRSVYNDANRHFGTCGLKFIPEYLIVEDIPYADLVFLLQKYEEAWDVYYGHFVYEPGGLGDELLAEGVTWCDMIEITNVMYGEQLGLPVFAPTGGDASGFNQGLFNPVYLLLKGAGEAFADAVIQAFFIWIADNGKEGFGETISCINGFDVLSAFVQGLWPGGGTTKRAVKASAIAAIVVMDRAIENENYTWDQAGSDFVAAFFKYFVEDIFGDAFAQFGTTLAKGAVKKFNLATNGFFGNKFSYSSICRWFGGGLVPGNYGLPTCNTCFFNTNTNAFEPVTVQRAMEGWDTVDEVYVIGTVQDRVNAFRDFLNTQPNTPLVKSINDDIDPGDWTFELNQEWIRGLKEEGKTIIDIGVHTGGSSGPNYGMEVDEIFN